MNINDYYPNNNQDPQTNPDVPTNSNERVWFSLTSLICGLLSIPLGFFTGYLGILTGVLGFLFGLFSKNGNPKFSNKAIVGIVTSITGFIAGVLMLALVIYLFTTDPDFLKEYQSLMEFYTTQ